MLAVHLGFQQNSADAMALATQFNGTMSGGLSYWHGVDAGIFSCSSCNVKVQPVEPSVVQAFGYETNSIGFALGFSHADQRGQTFHACKWIVRARLRQQNLF